jgi:hypothetical protein
MGFAAGARPAGGGGGGLASVNGDHGPDVVLGATDVGALALSGGTMSGDIDMGGGSVVNAVGTHATTAVSATTASLGRVDRYVATAAPVTFTISTADIVEDRSFVFKARSASVSVGTPVKILAEGGELIDGAAFITLEIDYESVTLVARGGNLDSEQ